MCEVSLNMIFEAIKLGMPNYILIIKLKDAATARRNRKHL